MSMRIERIEKGDFVKIFSLLFILVFSLTYAGVSCTQPGRVLGSESTDRDSDNDDDRDRRNSRTCEERDSCQDICDDLFSYTTERYACYELTSGDVNTISKVADEFYRSRVSLGDLEDLDPDSVSDYLDVGFDSFVDLVKGEAVGEEAKDDDGGQWADSKDREENSKILLQWIAEHKNVAEVILEQDNNFLLGMELFISLGNETSLPTTVTNRSSDDSCTDGSGGISVQISNGRVQCSSTELFSLKDFSSDAEALGFLRGFVKEDISSNDKFMTFSSDERNDSAFEWGHKTLLEFCKEATDENEDDVEVKTCLQTVYCLYRAGESSGTPNQGFEGIFEELKDHSDVVGRTDEEHCEDLGDDDEMENLFD